MYLFDPVHIQAHSHTTQTTAWCALLYAPRDLKLDNTLLEDSPSGPAYVRICDFGFAKAWTAATDNMKTAIGTPVYMSPQVRGCRLLTVRSVRILPALWVPFGWCRCGWPHLCDFGFAKA
jgi:serine/threonine protein kinase